MSKKSFVVRTYGNRQLSDQLQTHLYNLGYNWPGNMGKTPLTQSETSYREESAISIEIESGRKLLLRASITFYQSRPDDYEIITIDQFYEKYVLSQKATVKLNDEYTAEITKDEVKVGCQTFPASILQKLVDAHKTLNS